VDTGGIREQSAARDRTKEAGRRRERRVGFSLGWAADWAV
jgi:hypothetical protein